VTLRCFRGLLTLERSLTERRTQWLEQLPGIPESARAEIVEATKNLTDALTTVIDAADNGVYRSIDQMTETRQKLHAHYRIPAHQAMLRARAERLLTWMAHIAVRILAIAEKEADLRPEALEKLSEALTCLEQWEQPLQASLASKDYQKIEYDLPQQIAGWKNCSALIREARTIQDTPDPAEEETAE
jgi:hypothetical protein